MFTVLRGLKGPVGVEVVPGGDVLVVRPTGDDQSESSRLWRLTLNGRFEQIGLLPVEVSDFVPESASRMLVIPYESRRVERYDIVTGQGSVVADLSAIGLEPGFEGPPLTELVVLDDGSIVVSDGNGVWVIHGNEVRAVVRPADDVAVESLTPWAGGAFAYVSDAYPTNTVVRIGDDRRRRTLARYGPFTGVTLAPAGDAVVAVVTKPIARLSNTSVLGPVASRTQILRIAMRSVRRLVAQRIDAPVYGNGDGYGPTGFMGASRALIGGDGSLLFWEGDNTYGVDNQLRALIPQQSPRLRLALRPTTWRSFRRGLVHYSASAAGELDLRVRDARRKLITRMSTRTSAGAGTLRLRHPLPRGDYDVRLTLRTSQGGRATATANITTRTLLSMRLARKALERDYSQSEGDGGGAGGQEVSDRCVRRDSRRIDCRLIVFDSQRIGDREETTRRTCRGWAIARLRLDGVRTATTNHTSCPEL